MKIILLSSSSSYIKMKYFLRSVGRLESFSILFYVSAPFLVTRNVKTSGNVQIKTMRRSVGTMYEL